MAITLRCPGCGAHIRAKDEHAGKKGRCKECGTLFVIPALVAVAAPTPSFELEEEFDSSSPPSSSVPPGFDTSGSLGNQSASLATGLGVIWRNLQQPRGFTRFFPVDTKSIAAVAGIFGFLVGGTAAYLLCPTVVGERLPISVVISRGRNLEGMSEILLPLAERAFNTVLVGAVLGFLVAAALVYLRDLTRTREQSALRPRDRYGTR